MSWFALCSCGGSSSPVDSVSIPAAAPTPVFQSTFLNHGERVPFPTDAYLTPAGLDVPASPSLSDAERRLLSDLQGDDGYLAETSVFFPTTGRIPLALLSQRTVLLDVLTRVDLEHTVESQADGIRLVPAAELTPGRTYVAAVVGGIASQLHADPDGEELVDCAGELNASSADVLTCTRFTIRSRQVFKTPESTDGAMTFPRADPVISPLMVPENSFAGEFAALISEYDGYGSQSPLQLTFPDGLAARIDEDINVRRFALEQGVLREHGIETRIDPSTLPGHFVLSGSSDTPAGPGSTIGQIVLSDAEDLMVPSITTLTMTLTAPLVDAERGNESNVRFLSTTTAQTLEQKRLRAESFVSALSTTTILREDLLHLTLFEVGTAKPRIERMISGLDAQAIPTEVRDPFIATPWERGLPFFLSEVETIVTGTFPSLSFLEQDDPGISLEGVEIEIPFILTIPQSANPATPTPVVLFGHGLNTTRELVYLAANFLSEAGFAVFAFDFPYHGLRTPCLTTDDCPSEAQCQEDGVCRTSNGSELPVRTIASPISGGPAVPVSTGEAFIDLDHPEVTRNALLQALVDLRQSVRLIQGADWQQSVGYDLNSNDISYVGMSLGGILGAAFSSLESPISTFALNVPGSGVVDILLESDTLSPRVQEFWDETDRPPGSFGYFNYLHSARWLFDIVEPRALLASRPADRRYIIQMAEDDAVVPNSATHRLSDVLDVPITMYTPLVSGHAFLFDPLSFEADDAREEILDFLDGR